MEPKGNSAHSGVREGFLEEVTREPSPEGQLRINRAGKAGGDAEGGEGSRRPGSAGRALGPRGAGLSRAGSSRAVCGWRVSAASAPRLLRPCVWLARVPRGVCLPWRRVCPTGTGACPALCCVPSALPGHTVLGERLSTDCPIDSFRSQPSHSPGGARRGPEQRGLPFLHPQAGDSRRPPGECQPSLSCGRQPCAARIRAWGCDLGARVPLGKSVYLPGPLAPLRVGTRWACP